MQYNTNSEGYTIITMQLAKAFEIVNQNVCQSGLLYYGIVIYCKIDISGLGTKLTNFIMLGS